MNLKLAELSEPYAIEICDWKYDGDYSIYNYPEWDNISNEKWAITVEAKRIEEFSAVVDDDNNLCGYIRLMVKNEDVLIGIGLKPSLCGQGLGDILMELLKHQCKVLYPSKKITLEVRSFNERAIKCYQKAGFQIKEKYNKDTPMSYGEFIRMEFSSIIRNYN